MDYQEQSEAAEMISTLIGARWFVLVILSVMVFGLAPGGIVTSGEILGRVGALVVGALIATLLEWMLVHSRGMRSAAGLRFVQGLHIVLIVVFVAFLLWFSEVTEPWMAVLFLVPVVEAGIIAGPIGVLAASLLALAGSWSFFVSLTAEHALLRLDVGAAIADPVVLELFFPHVLLVVAFTLLSAIGSYAWRRERDVLHHARQRAYSLLVELEEGVIVYDDRFIVRYINPAAERLLGAHRRDIVGHQAGRFATISAPGVENLSRVLFAKLEGQGGQPVEVKNPDRSLIIAQRSLFGPEGEPLGLVRLLRDVTHQRRVGRLKSEFISVAAHQLRTPLSGVRWAIEELKGDPALTGAQRTAVLQAGEAVNRTIVLVNELLDIARIEEGRFDYEMTSAQLEQIVDDVVRELMAKSKEKGVVLEYTSPQHSIPPLVMDVEKMRMVVETVIDNAINYTPADGRVFVEVAHDNDVVVLKVEDTGVGIPNDQQDRIFTKFFRGDNVVRLQTEGSGLGLFIAQNIVRRHGGSIWFESEKGTGTRFFVSLPLNEGRPSGGEKK